MKKTLITVLAAMFIGNAAAQQKAEPVYIDVRTWAEHKVDSIEGDTRIHVSEIVAGVDELFPDKDTPIHLYCAAGGRAGTAVQKLSEAGYTNVHNAGGIDDVRKVRAAESSSSE